MPSSPRIRLGEIFTATYLAFITPLVRPTAAADWTGAPPSLFLCGEGRGADSNKVVAQRALSQGSCAVWEQYEVMPHGFMLLLKSSHSRSCLSKDGRASVGSVSKKPVPRRGGGNFIDVETLSAKEVDVGIFTELTDEDAVMYNRAQMTRRRAWNEKRRNVKPSL